MLHVTETSKSAPNHADLLPLNRARWPEAAQRAFRRTFAELNAWDRDREHHSPLNAWIAEQAVREAWESEKTETDLKVA